MATATPVATSISFENSVEFSERDFCFEKITMTFMENYEQVFNRSDRGFVRCASRGHFGNGCRFADVHN
jgi:hypothetical protein